MKSRKVTSLNFIGCPGLSLRWPQGESDLLAIMEVERPRPGFCREDPWTEEQISHELRKWNSICLMAVCREGEVSGYMIFRCLRSSLRLMRISVSWESRRMGIGTRLIHELKVKAENTTHGRISALVNERNLAAQRLLAKSGFLCVPPIVSREPDCLYRFAYCPTR
jgi:ribosomal protein S18 acetylase RimI-like enzyme